MIKGGPVPVDKNTGVGFEKFTPEPSSMDAEKSDLGTKPLLKRVSW
jgi:hypothetical protein